MAQVARAAAGVPGGPRDTALYIDETSFAKKGTASVGVKRQSCGRLGKLENCQVGVFACLGRGERTALVDFRLFLPQEWAADSARCQRVKIPEAERLHRPKPQNTDARTPSVSALTAAHFAKEHRQTTLRETTEEAEGNREAGGRATTRKHNSSPSRAA